MLATASPFGSRRSVSLAESSDGTPAIALNKLGKGTILLLNWHAEKAMPPPIAETVKVLLGTWVVGVTRVYDVFRREFYRTNAPVYTPPTRSVLQA